MKKYKSSYGEHSMKGDAKTLVKNWEGIAYQYEREGNYVMMHVARNHSDHYKRVNEK